MKGSLLLIASYPKSGNTWTRIVFERMLRGPRMPINSLADSFHGIARRMLFDDFAPVCAADLLEDEIENFLPGVYRQLVSEIDGPAFVKVHESAHRTTSGEWLYPPDCVSAAIYLARHPFDVAVSSSHHFHIDLATAVELMSHDRSMERAHSRLTEPLPQYFGSWSENVASWIENAPYKVAFARYEDLHKDPIGEFSRLARAAGLPVAKDRMAAAVEASRFERLQSEERAMGFREKAPQANVSFFREGRTRSWQGVLDKSLRARLAQEHAPMMERLGYSPDGETLPLPAS